MMQYIEFVIDAVIICLLLATIISAYLLNQKLKVLRAAKKEMEGLFAEFHQISQKLEHELSVAKNTAKDACEDLDFRIGKSKKLSDDLKYIVDTAEARAGKLELLLAQSARLLKSQNNASSASAEKQSGGAKRSTGSKPIRKRSKVVNAPAKKASSEKEEDVALTKSSEELRQSIEDLQ